MPGKTGTAIVIASPRGGLGVESASESSSGKSCGRGAKRNKPKARPAGQILDALHAIGKQGRIAAKLVDEKPYDHFGVGWIEHGLGANDLSDDAAAIDVAGQNHRNTGGAGKTHIGDIVFAQIDFRSAPRAFDEDKIGVFAKGRETVEHDWQKLWFQALVLACLRLAYHPAAQNDLCAISALWLQEDRIHVDAWRYATSFCLGCLGAADFSAIRGHRGVVRHVLRLERAHL